MSVIERPIPAQAPAIAPKPFGGQSKFKAALVNRARLYLVLYLLLLPTIVGMILFNYLPKWQEVVYSFYKWDGQFTLDWVGWGNYVTALFGDKEFWPSFRLVGIMLVANLVKMLPSMFAAIVLHRIKSDRWQYLYRVLFVVPMVIPGLVWLLIWKNFFDPNIGLLNRFLNGTGLMHVLQWMDGTMPVAAASLNPIVRNIVAPGMGSLWGMILLGAVVLTMVFGVRGIAKGWVWWTIMISVGLGLWGPTRLITTMLPAVAVGEVLRRSEGGKATLKWIGGLLIGIGACLILLTMIWYEPTGAFKMGNPSWLSHTKLVIPSLVFWGFPWVGTVGVLIYLAGLQQISNDVYEAAELDGVTSLGKALYIELPLMMTQVRINLIFMTIGTLNDYGLVLLLLGPWGGPDGVGNTPGLYMYRAAFLDGKFGYACALGMVLFVLILLITIIYQKYVKVDK